MGIGERVGNELNILEAGEKFEERVAGLGEEEFVAGIAEQAEHVGVGFAGAGGEEEGFGIDGGVMVVEIVAGNFLAGGECAFGLGIVGECGGILECGEDGAGVVVKTALRGVGGGEIEEGTPVARSSSRARVRRLGESGQLVRAENMEEVDSLQSTADSLQLSEWNLKPWRILFLVREFET